MRVRPSERTTRPFGRATAPRPRALFFATRTPVPPMLEPYRRSLHSMAALVPGARAEIRYIAFRGIREACRDAGVREGDVVVCRANGSDALVLETPDHGTVSLDGAWARFIEVDVRRPAAGGQRLAQA